MTPLLDLPKSRPEIERIQSERKKHALAQARRAPFYKGRLDHVNTERLAGFEECLRQVIFWVTRSENRLDKCAVTEQAGDGS